VRFLVDASSDARLADHLSSLGHDFKRVGRDELGDLPDREVIAIAVREHRILITDGRDFGELVFRLREAHVGVIYLRLETTVLSERIARLDNVLATHGDRLDRFLVVGPDNIRVAGEP
jgi:predicted nuclease of predicted toxin-antitoxin system